MTSANPQFNDQMGRFTQFTDSNLKNSSRGACSKWFNWLFKCEETTDPSNTHSPIIRNNQKRIVYAPYLDRGEIDCDFNDSDNDNQWCHSAYFLHKYCERPELKDLNCCICSFKQKTFVVINNIRSFQPYFSTIF